MLVKRYAVVQHCPEYGDDDLAVFDTSQEAFEYICGLIEPHSPCTVDEIEEEVWDILDSDSPLLGGPLTPGSRHEAED